MAHQLHSRLLVLGHFLLRREGDEPHVISLSSKKARALVAFLAMQPERVASREQIAALLWGERSDKNARQALRQCLSVLRNELSSAQLEMLNSDGDRIGLRRETLSIDVLEFLALAESPDAGDVTQACALYRGEFLYGLDLDSEVFEQWVREQRARIEMAAARVLETHARQTNALGKSLQAITTVDRLIAIDPLREDWQRLGLEICARHQGREAALARAKSFVALLHAELGVAPEVPTTALIADIRRGAVASFHAPARLDATLPTPAGKLHGPTATMQPAEREGADHSGKRRQDHLAGLRRLSATLRSPLSSPRNYALAIGFIAAIAIDAILDAGIGPWYEKVFGTPSAAAQHTGELSSQAHGAPPLTSPAALPLLVIAAREEGSADRAVVDAFTDELADRLSGFSGIRVISRQTANLFLTKAGDAAKLGSEFGVRYIVEASLHSREATTRINIELIDAPGRREIWSEQTDTLTNALERDREEISSASAAKIRVQLDRATHHFAGPRTAQ